MADNKRSTEKPKGSRKIPKRWRGIWADWVPPGHDQEPEVMPFFGVKPYGANTTCADIHPNGPIPEGDRVYCPSCHKTGLDRHPKVVLSQSEIPPPESKAPEPPEPKQSRKQKRAEVAKLLCKGAKPPKSPKPPQTKGAKPQKVKAAVETKRPYKEIRAERFEQALANSRGVRSK